MSMCMQKSLVYVGDSAGKVHILDEKKNFELVKSFTTEHKNGINGIQVNAGCLITSSRDKTVRITAPTDPPKPLRTLSSNHGEIASVGVLFFLLI